MLQAPHNSILVFVSQSDINGYIIQVHDVDNCNHEIMFLSTGRGRWSKYVWDGYDWYYEKQTHC